MAVARQLPARVDIHCVAGNPFVLPTITFGGAAVTELAVTVKTDQGVTVTADPSVPAVSLSGSVATLTFSAADTAALNTSPRYDRSYSWSLRGLVDGTGPYELVAGTLTVSPVGTAKWE